MLNPQSLNITLPPSTKSHTGRAVPLAAADVTGLMLVFDGDTAAPVQASFTGGAVFNLAGLAQYGNLAPGNHTVSVAVITKRGTSAFTPPVSFTISDSVDAPAVTLS